MPYKCDGTWSHLQTYKKPKSYQFPRIEFCNLFFYDDDMVLLPMELESVVVVINKPKQGSQTKPQYRNLVTSSGKLKESIHQKM